MKEALKLALDLAIMHHSDDGYAELRSKVRQLAKEALAQPEQEPCGGCGGSGWVPRDPDIGTDQECFDCNGSGAQPEQEPVAWEQFYPDIGKPQLKQELVAIYRAGQAKGERFHVEFLKEMGDDEVLLYTTPPKRPWVGLTNEEIKVIHFDLCNTVGSDYKTVARAVEAKLKEKNT